MQTKRILAGGQRDLQGETFGRIRVGDIVNRRPLRWHGSCTRCGIAQTFDHQALLSGTARCQNGGCGREAQLEELADTPRKARQREADAKAKQERQLEAAQQEALQAAEAQYKTAHQKLGYIVRDYILKMRDDGLTVDPETASLRLTEDQAETYNREQIASFRRSHPEAAWTQRNIDTLGDYLARNSLHVVSERTLAAAYERLESYGLLEQRPAPPPVRRTPDPAPAEAEAEVSTSVQPKSTISGYDFQTGLQREYTPREIDRMSADTYRRVFRLTKADIALPLGHRP